MAFVEATILLFKCPSHQKHYAVRVEKVGNDWVRTWAFPTTEKRAKNENYDKQQVVGSLNATSEFPGCPYCRMDGFMKCSCGKLSCYHQEMGDEVVCPWCHQSGKLTTATQFSVDGDSF